MKNRIVLIICIASCAQASNAPPTCPVPIQMQQNPVSPELMTRYVRMVQQLAQAPALSDDLQDGIKDLTGTLRAAGSDRIANQLMAIVSTFESQRGPSPTLIAMQINPLGRTNPETLNLDDTEMFSQETFGVLIKAQAEHDEKLIVARVYSYNKDGSMSHYYYNAFPFNQWRFGQTYSLTHPISIANNKNPLNGNAVGDVQYFIYDPENPAAGLQYAFSAHDFINNSITRQLVDVEQNEDLERKVAAATNLGDIYASGSGVPVDWVKAKRYYERAVAQDVNTPAKERAQAMLHAINAGSKPTVTKILPPQARAPIVRLPEQPSREGQGRLALERQQLSALGDRNTPTNALRLADMFFKGLGGPVNSHNAALLYNTVINADTATADEKARAKVALAELIIGGRGIRMTLPDVFKMLQEVEQQTVNPAARAMAQVWLALFYVRPLLPITTADLELARKYSEAGANQTENPRARAMAWRNLGNIYCNGLGVQIDYAQALDFYQKAADQNADLQSAYLACYGLGMIHFMGLGVPKNLDLAEEYLLVVAHQNVDQYVKAKAQYELGLLYLAKKDPVKARGFFELAEGQNAEKKIKAEAAYELGLMYFNGLGGLTKDLVKAQHYFEKVGSEAQLNKQRQAKAWLSYLLSTKPVPDYAKAIEYARDAKKSINKMASSLARSVLSHSYLAGEGVEKDPERAARYWAVPAVSEVEPRARALEDAANMLSQGIGWKKDLPNALSHVNGALKLNLDSESKKRLKELRQEIAAKIEKAKKVKERAEARRLALAQPAGSEEKAKEAEAANVHNEESSEEPSSKRFRQEKQ